MRPKAELHGLPQHSLGERVSGVTDNFFEVWATLSAYLSLYHRSWMHLQTAKRHEAIEGEHLDWQLHYIWVWSMGHLHVVHLLLKAEVDTESRAGDSVTPLTRVAARGHLQIVKVVLEGGVNVNV